MTDLEAALRATRVGWGANQNFRKIYAIVDGLDTNQFGAAITACLKSSNWGTKGVAIQDIGARWGRIDPQGALAFAQNLPSASQRNQVIGAILSGWAENDPDAATAWAKQQPDGQARNQALSAVAGLVAAQDPQAGLALMNSVLLLGDRARGWSIRYLTNGPAVRRPMPPRPRYN